MLLLRLCYHVNFKHLGQTYARHYDLTNKFEPRTSRLSRSLKVSGTDTD